MTLRLARNCRRHIAPATPSLQRHDAGNIPAHWTATHPTPGAKMSTQGPKLENTALLSELFVAPTVIAAKGEGRDGFVTRCEDKEHPTLLAPEVFNRPRQFV